MSTQKSGKTPEDDAKRDEAKKLEEQRLKAQEREEVDRQKLLRRLLREKGRVRVSELYEHFNPRTPKERDEVRGFVRRIVEEGILFDFVDDDPKTGKTATWYYVNDEKFYDPKKLVALVPRSEIDRIGDLLEVREWTLGAITRQLYGKRPNPPVGFVGTILRHFIDRGLLVFVKKDAIYAATQRGKEFGIDSQTLLTLDATALENQLVAREESEAPKIVSLEQYENLCERDVREKMVKPVKVSEELAKKKSVKMLFLSEILSGNQCTDAELLNWILDDSGVAPDITLVSGLVQGSFTGQLVDKRRTLMNIGGMGKVGHQFHVAGLLLSRVDRITKHGVYVVQGDDDWEIAKDNAKLAQLAEGKIWNFGVCDSLTSEQDRRMMIREFYNKWEIQWERIIAYQYRIGRGLYNAIEVERMIGVRKREYRLIIEILIARRRGIEYPKEYEKVVNLPALLGDLGIRHVSPNTLILELGGGRRVQLVHNFHFSNVTQYVDPLRSPEMAMRQLGARGGTPPLILAGAHQECFYAHYMHGKNWVMTLPGMKSAFPASTFEMREFHSRVLSGKEHRQSTFRMNPSIPAGLEVETFSDGRMRFRLLNNRAKQVIEANAGKPEVKKTLVLVSDTQNGSGTMEPECLVKWMDYALYERKGEVLWEDGDVIHGFNYRQHPQENERDRIVAVRSQERFTTLTQIPLIVDAPALEEFVAVEGNHEWDTMGVRDNGASPLSFLYHELDGYIAGLKKAGVKPRLQRAIVPDRIRWLRTHNPRPDAVYWPYFAAEFAGFKFAMMHMWQPGGKKGGGGGGMRTPVDEMRMWMRNMADACGDIDVMIGGHHHSVWMCQEANKLLLKIGAAASQSGYELVRGFMSTVMFTLIEVSNRTGITVEFVPWQFLLNKYECQSPFLKGKDNDLRLPKRGTLEFRHAKRSPFIEHLLDESQVHFEV